MRRNSPIGAERWRASLRLLAPLLLPCGLLVASRAWPATASGRLPVAIELGIFMAGAALAQLLPAPRRRRGRPSAASAAALEADSGPSVAALPHGTEALIEVLSRALGGAQIALFVRHGARLSCCAQAPAPFGAQALALKLLPLLPQGPAEATRALSIDVARRGGRSTLRRLAVPLYPQADPAGPPGHAELDTRLPWGLLLAQRTTAPFAQADAEMMGHVAEQIAASLKLERALRDAQADRMRLEHMATTDALTELANRRHFMRIFALQLARAKRYGRRLSLIFLDIDHFKQVNDTFGHAVGDEVLRGFARVLRTTARSTDTVARYGGEEFAILMEETDAAGAHVIAERIRAALRQTPFGPCATPFFKTCSVGVATFPEHGADAELLIACADTALYEAKRSGRDRITLYRGPTPASEGI